MSTLISGDIRYFFVKNHNCHNRWNIILEVFFIKRNISVIQDYSSLCIIQICYIIISAQYKLGSVSNDYVKWTDSEPMWTGSKGSELSERGGY